jgi:D-alanyl-D-alanine carboxypeptidase
MTISTVAARIAARIAVICAVFGLVLTGAEAASKASGGGYAPPYSEIVVDVRTGKVLRAVNPDSPRHPASITKVMTLYLLFEQLEAGKMSLSTPIRISEWAARQSPSKLGLNPGETITVDDAIKAIVTRSANDIAVAVAEAVGGSEKDFAAMMTQKARSLGMKRTVYANASGLPNPRQTTTARDLVVLGKSIQTRFPRYFQYFSLRSFDYEGATIGNHNKLLGRVDGVDGIKTGYTAKSGFNLLTSVHSDGRSLLAVILGGRSGNSRDRRMAELVDAYLDVASNGDIKAAPKTAKKISEAPTPVDIERPSSDNEDMVENPTASLSSPAQPAAKGAEQQSKLVWKPGAAPAPVSKALGYTDTQAAATPSSQADKNRTWWIQVGVAPNQKQAKSLIDNLSGQLSSILNDAKPAIEKVQVKGREMWRTRFTRMSLDDAQTACALVKKQGGACFASRS